MCTIEAKLRGLQKEREETARARLPTRKPNGPRKVGGHVILGSEVAFEFQTVVSSQQRVGRRDYPDIRGRPELS